MDLGNPTEPIPPRRRRWLLLGLAPIALAIPTLTTYLPYAFLPFVLTAAGLVVLRASRWTDARVTGVVLAVSAAAAAYVFLYGGSLTDEWAFTPGFVQLFPNLYGAPLTLHWTVPLWPHLIPYYGHHGVAGHTYFDDYLPLISLAQIPGLPFQVVSVGCWLGLVELCRRRNRPLAALAFSTPYFGLLAESGFNDLVPLFLLTVMVTAETQTASILSDVLAVGMKQMAPVLSVAYHAARREWRRLAVAAGATVAILLPFYLMDPAGTVCHAILLQQSCASGSSGSPIGGGMVFDHLNYYLYPLWVGALFDTTLIRWARRAIARVRGPGRATGA